MIKLSISYFECLLLNSLTSVTTKFGNFHQLINLFIFISKPPHSEEIVKS